MATLQDEILDDVAGRLERAGLNYMLVGSTAVSVYSPSRTTIDIDIVVELVLADVERIVELFADDYYLDELAIEEAITRRSSFNLIHYTKLIKVDLMIAAETDYRRTQFSRRRRLPSGDSLVWVAAPEDLILSKLDWARQSRSERQLDDVRIILRRVEPLDHEYLDIWAERLGLTDLLREVNR